MKRFGRVSSALTLVTLGMSGLFSSPLAQARGATASQRPYVDIATITPGAPKNMFNSSGNSWGGMDRMPLGFSQVSPNPYAIFPGLAASWKPAKNGRAVTVFLQPKARWSNGKAVTPHDVIVTAALYFVINYAKNANFGSAQNFALGSVKALGPRTLLFKEAPKGTYNLFAPSVLGMDIAPASVFGHLLPSNIWSLINTSQYTGKNAAKVAAQKAAVTKLTAIADKVTAYDPPRDISDGPYVLANMNPGEAVMVKNKYFYAANRIHINEVILRNYSGNQQIWNYLIGGQVYQATSGGMSLDLVHQILRTPGNVAYKVPSNVSSQLVFNENVYPYGMVKVRQALAYIINRAEVQKVAEPTGGSRSVWSDGMIDSVTRHFLSKKLQAKLNKYSVNDAKASALLTSAGFKKTGGKWIMPNGQPFNVTLNVVNGFTDWIEAAQNMSSQLSSFGITAQPNVVSAYSQYLTELAQGKIAVGFWIGSLGANPYSMWSRLYGTGDGYNIVGGQLTYYTPSHPNGGNWLDLPQTVSVKGYGNVAVGPLTYQLNTLRNQNRIKAIVTKLTFATNQYVPAITLWNYVQAGFVNTRFFTDYPLKNKKVMSAGQGYYPPIGAWETLGYVRPK